MQINMFFHDFVTVSSIKSSSKHTRAISEPLLRADLVMQNLMNTKRSIKKIPYGHSKRIFVPSEQLDEYCHIVPSGQQDTSSDELEGTKLTSRHSHSNQRKSVKHHVSNYHLSVMTQLTQLFIIRRLSDLQRKIERDFLGKSRRNVEIASVTQFTRVLYVSFLLVLIYCYYHYQLSKVNTLFIFAFLFFYL
ncbi:hypothetical protein PUN28_007201 [Cardiocondyla obscurior]|uniref:Uncharacterized protein n=1 Tax=Cardiocondyla obscurior TaxID=286306 RepID=A0AAW2G776_9HYME